MQKLQEMNFISDPPSFYEFIHPCDIWIKTGIEDNDIEYGPYKLIKPIWEKSLAMKGDLLFNLGNGRFLCDKSEKILVECSSYEPSFEPNLTRISTLDQKEFDLNKMVKIKTPKKIREYRFASYIECKNLVKNRTINHEEYL